MSPSGRRSATGPSLLRSTSRRIPHHRLPGAAFESDSWVTLLAGKHGKAKALSILAAKLGRAVYHLLRKQRTFDAERFFAMS